MRIDNRLNRMVVVAVALLLICARTQARMARPGEQCQIPAAESWSATERWAWTQICMGRSANFNRRYGKRLDLLKAKGWDDTRELSSVFLETVLLHEPYRSAITRIGVRIVGAWIWQRIDLRSARVKHGLWIHASRFERPVILRSAAFSESLSFSGSHFVGKLDMSGLRVGENLFMRGGARFGAVELGNAHVSGQLSMTGSNFIGALSLNGIQVGRSLIMRGGASFRAVDLKGASVGGQISMIGSKFAGKLEMSGLQVGDSLQMRGKAEFAAVRLNSAYVRGQISMVGAKFTGLLSMDSLRVGSDLFMRGSHFKAVVLRGVNVGGQISMNGSKFTSGLIMDSVQVGRSLLLGDGGQFGFVLLRGAKVGGQIAMAGSKFTGRLIMDSVHVGQSLFMDDGAQFRAVEIVESSVGGLLTLSDATFGTLNLTGTSVSGELLLGSSKSKATRWRKGAMLNLRNSTIGALQDRIDAWPQRLVLDGFVYKRLGGLQGTGDTADMSRRDTKWFIAWLERDTEYSPQPYTQLASVLRAAGFAEKADTILFASKRREMDEDWGRGERIAWLWSATKLIFIGFGYRTHYAIFWVLGLVVIGALVFRRSPEAQAGHYNVGLAYSLDMLLPIIKLREVHYDIDLISAGPRYYFYFHKAKGYALVSFLIAGLSGLTK